MIDSVLLVRPYAAEKKEFPLGSLYVGTALKRKGYQVKIIDLQDYPDKEEVIIQILRSSPSTMLGISALAPHYRWVKNFTLKIKKLLPETKIIVGGHIAICRNILLEHSGVDFVCVGEGEETLPELIETLNRGEPVQMVAGLAYKDENKNIVKTAWRPLLKDFGIPDYDLIDVTRYLIHPNDDIFFSRSSEYAAVSTPHDNVGVIMFSRGCVGHCGFCYRHLSGFRQMTVEQAWEHMMLMYRNYNIKYFRIDDELFTNSTEWLRAFCEKLKQSNLGILFRITGLRVDTIDDERLELLKQAGCVGVNYGIESCSQAILNNMLKMVTVKQNIEAIEKTMKHGMVTMAYIIWGYEGENKTTIKETVDALLALALPAYLVSIFYLVALPGTTIYMKAIRSGQIKDEDAYLDSLYALMEKSENIHKMYYIHFSDLSFSEMRKQEEMLLFLLKLQQRLGPQSAALKLLRSAIELTPAGIFLPVLNMFDRTVQTFRKITNPNNGLFGSIKMRFSMMEIANFLIKINSQFLSPPVKTNQERLRLTVDWLAHAQDAVSPGISRGYSLIWENKFGSEGWQPAYPETTGYIIPTLLRAHEYFADTNLLERAIKAADWEIEIMYANGAVKGGYYSFRHRQPAIFDTGQVVRGLLALYEKTRDEKYLIAAEKSSDWILSNEDRRMGGVWIANNAEGVDPLSTTYNIYAIAPIAGLGNTIKNEAYLEVARRAGNRTLSMQTDTGWFNGADFANRKDALLHTIAYTIDGLWDVGCILDEKKFRDAARFALDGVLSRMKDDGFIPGRLDTLWNPSVGWACLTGTAQIGVSCFKVYKFSKEQKYLQAALKARDYIHRCQNQIDGKHGGLGAVWGSWPISGGYQPYQALNWAVKYYADLLLEILSLDKT